LQILTSCCYRTDVPADNQPAPTSPFGTVPDPFAFAFSNVSATQFSGGTAKIVDSSTFKISVTIAAAEVTVEPGAMRELHVRFEKYPLLFGRCRWLNDNALTFQWHPTEDEWTFFLEGEGRITLFASQSNARTFDFQAGDVGTYITYSFTVNYL
jgi:oxalate decarboxylase/phosphoglucose isomerase-like protein (cupin superfamily)